jgi:hypothetical protein
MAVTRSGVPRLETSEMLGQEGDILHFAVMKDAVSELDGRIRGTPARRAE